MDVPENLHINLNKRNNAFISEQSREDVTLFEIISKLRIFYARAQPLASSIAFHALFYMLFLANA
jgi:hypothetical protein